ncbi:zf-HC2 domain-containing protein [Streptomyces sp. NPDC000880]
MVTMGTGAGGLEGPGGMDCDTARESLSALLDGEAMLGAREDLDAHVAACRGCRQWQEAAHLVTRRARLIPAPSVPDSTERILTAVLADRSPREGRRTARLVRSGLAAAALAHSVIIVPALAGRAAVGVPMRASQELATFNLTLAVALLAAAVRPAWARAMLPVVGVAVGFLAVFAFVGAASGYTTMRAEAPHLITLVGAVLLAVLTRTFSGDTDGPAHRPLLRHALFRTFRRRRLPTGLARFVRPSGRGVDWKAAHGSAPTR